MVGGATERLFFCFGRALLGPLTNEALDYRSDRTKIGRLRFVT